MLGKWPSTKEFFEHFNREILPAAARLVALSEGSVCFTVQAETNLALEELYERYSTGRLQRDLQEFLVTDDIRQLADGEEVIVCVQVEEQEFREARNDLKNIDKGGHCVTIYCDTPCVRDLGALFGHVIKQPVFT